jgi:hypothetical protein
MSTLRRRIEALERAAGPPCEGPPPEFRYGTEAELAAWPPGPKECPLCGLDHLGDSIRFIAVVRHPDVT